MRAEAKQVTTNFLLSGDGCVEKPLATLWRNYTQSSRPDVSMQLTVSAGGLKATTKDHGLTEYWANRLTFCAAPTHFPRIFCWVYRHEGRRLRHELRCHAVLCSSSSIAQQIETNLKHSLYLALTEFKRDKVSRQNARLSLVNSIYDNPTMPRRKILLSTGSNNYRPPLERSKSAPKLVSIEEIVEEEEEHFEGKPRSIHPRKILRPYDSTSALLDKRKRRISKEQITYQQAHVPDIEDVNDIIQSHEEKIPFSKISHNLDLNIDEKSNLVLEALVQESMSNELIESCTERIWFRNLRTGMDLLPLDSDEGSLSSGCESASTVTSDSEQTLITTIEEIQEEGVPSNAEDLTQSCDSENRKTEHDFKVGGCVLTQVRSFERLTGIEISRFCGLNSSLSTSNILNEEVSLIPVGESQTDFSSLKVYKRRSNSESGLNIIDYCSKSLQMDNSEEEENTQDEGYDEVIDCASSVSNIVLI